MRIFILLLFLWVSGYAEADGLEALQLTVADDLKSGRPLVVQVHVPLCSSSIIKCGNPRLGNGDNPDTNLYWATSGGFKGWFKKQRAWKLVHTVPEDRGDLLEQRVWRKRQAATKAWRKLGVTQSFDVYVVANAWRGKALKQTLDTYLRQLQGRQPETVTLPNGVSIAAGGAAHIISYVGHNGWMDYPDYSWNTKVGAQSETKGTIAVACATADYLASPLAHERRVPLLMTTSLMFAGAHSFEGAVSAFATGKGLREIRRGAARNHAIGQEREYRRVIGAFTNPSDKRWRNYVETE